MSSYISSLSSWSLQMSSYISSLRAHGASKRAHSSSLRTYGASKWDYRSSLWAHGCFFLVCQCWWTLNVYLTLKKWDIQAPSEFCTHERVRSSRPPMEPMISPKVQKVWPRKSFRDQNRVNNPTHTGHSQASDWTDVEHTHTHTYTRMHTGCVSNQGDMMVTAQSVHQTCEPSAHPCVQTGKKRDTN